MDEQLLTNKSLRKALKRPVEALSWVGECSEMVKRFNGLESWPFPTFKGQPLEPMKYPRQQRVNPEWSDALM